MTWCGGCATVQRKARSHLITLAKREWSGNEVYRWMVLVVEAVVLILTLAQPPLLTLGNRIRASRLSRTFLLLRRLV